jgi:2-polyprenyl-3-methyl-5-hydroxy-6-metoxy-1,4-benzoquinol methylase
LSSSTETSTCPLCGGRRIRVIKQLSGQQLRRLWQEAGTQFTPEAWGRIGEQSVIALQRCDECGFAFFDPSLAGNGAFYEQLERPGYYSPERPEFRRTTDFAGRKGLRRVLDVGCGSGAFLDLAREAGCETFGLELNPTAAAKAEQKGHNIFNEPLERLSVNSTGGYFDLITLFQVLEHLSNPVSMLKSAVELVRDGGYVAIAVPSEEGVLRLNPWDPTQWPPHHVSRWRRADLAQLGRAAGLKLVECGGDRLYGSDIVVHWRTHNRMAAVLGKPRHAGGDALGEFISFVFRKSGMKFLFDGRGASIYAFYQKG